MVQIYFLLFSIFDVLRIFEALQIFLESQKYYFAFESRLILFYFFWNGHIRNVVSTLPNVVKIDVENDNVVSTLSNVVQFNVEIHNVVSTLLNVVNFNVDVHNVVSTLIWRCATSRCHTSYQPKSNVEPTLKCLLGTIFHFIFLNQNLTYSFSLILEYF